MKIKMPDGIVYDENGSKCQSLKDEKISELNSYINVLQKENVELKKLITALYVAKSAIEFRMKSDDACEMPFDEDLSEALKEIERLLNQ